MHRGIAWDGGTNRRPLSQSLAVPHRFIDDHDQWVIEGCYGDLVEAARPFCTKVRFLNPGVEACVAHCRRRPWEPEKFADAHAQQAMLEPLIEWLRAYEARDDEFELRRHRRLFDAFGGPKGECTSVAACDLD